MTDTPTEATPISTVAERRAGIRTRLNHLVLAKLGDENGGIVSDISEHGLCLAAALPLVDTDLPSIRIQLPGSKDTKQRIEAHGQIVWKSESKLRAGIQFIGLSEQTRRQIRGWIAAETVSVPVSAARDPAVDREKNAEKAEALEDSILGGGTFVAVDGREQDGDLTDTFPLQGSGAAEEIEDPSLQKSESGEVSQRGGWAAEETLKSHPQAPKHTTQFTAAHDRKNYRPPKPSAAPSRRKHTGRLAAVIFLVAVLSFGIGWLTSSPAARNMILRLAKSESASTQSIDANAAPVAPKSAPAPNAEDALVVQSPPDKDQVQTEGPRGDEEDVTRADTAESSAPNKSRQEKATSPSTSVPEPPNATQKPYALNRGSAEEQPAATAAPSSATAADRDSAADRASATNPQQKPPDVPPKAQASPTSGNPSQANSAPAQPSAPPAPNHDQEPSPQQAQQQAPTDIPGSVVVVADPYPSIRLPLGTNSRKSPSGERLQLGRLITRVDPVYPIDAKQHAIEGAVTLRALIGSDGSVQDVVSVNGPSLLIPAAVNAVRQWKYSQTLVAGQPVETEENISVKFQLSK